MRRALQRGGLLLGAAGVATALYPASTEENKMHVDLSERLPTRPELVSRLKEAGRDNPFDMLIIGGGATGTGCALDAATRCVRVNGPAVKCRCLQIAGRVAAAILQGRRGLEPGCGGFGGCGGCGQGNSGPCTKCRGAGAFSLNLQCVWERV